MFHVCCFSKSCCLLFLDIVGEVSARFTNASFFRITLVLGTFESFGPKKVCFQIKVFWASTEIIPRWDDKYPLQEENKNNARIWELGMHWYKSAYTLHFLLCCLLRNITQTIAPELFSFVSIIWKVDFTTLTSLNIFFCWQVKTHNFWLKPNKRLY